MMVHRWTRAIRSWARRVAGRMQVVVTREPRARIRVTNGFREIYIRWNSDADPANTTEIDNLITFLTTPQYFRGYAPYTIMTRTVETNLRTYHHISLVYAPTGYHLPGEEAYDDDEVTNVPV